MAEIREVIYQYSKGISQRNISQSLGISRVTIRQYIKVAKGSGYHGSMSSEQIESLSVLVQQKIYSSCNRSHPSRDALKPYHDRIEQLLKEPWITQKQIYKLLCEEGLESVETSVRSLSRYINSYFPTLPKSTVHLLTTPAHEAQVDYGYVGIINKRKTYAFVMTLSHSRHRFVEFVHTQDQLSWAQSHINAFYFFKGVPKCVVLDNLKSGVISADIYDPTLNETYSELSRFYGFVADPAKARSPQHKGKVERSIGIVKAQLIAGRTYKNLEEMNTFAREWCTHKISHVVCSTIGQKPIDVFKTQELPLLRALPSQAFDMPQWLESKVHKDHHFVVKGNFYSVPTQFIDRTLQIRLGLKTVRAYDNHKLVKVHVRHYGKGQWITDKNDYPDSAQYYLDNTSDICLSKARKIGKATEQLVSKVLEPDTRTSLRKAQGILRLADKYNASRLEDACLRAIVFDNYSYKALSRILENGLDKKQTKTFSIKKLACFYTDKDNTYSSSMEINYV